jgi:hypothetical protein
MTDPLKENVVVRELSKRDPELASEIARELKKTDWLGMARESDRLKEEARNPTPPEHRPGSVEAIGAQWKAQQASQGAFGLTPVSSPVPARPSATEPQPTAKPLPENGHRPGSLEDVAALWKGSRNDYGAFGLTGTRPTKP